MNAFPEGKCVQAQQTKLYVRLLPKKSTQYCLNKKWESKNHLVTSVLHVRYAEKASQIYDIAKVVLSITVKGTNKLVTPRISIAFMKRIGSKKGQNHISKRSKFWWIKAAPDVDSAPSCVNGAYFQHISQSAFNLSSMLLHCISV